MNKYCPSQQGDPGPRGTKGRVGDFGEDGNILTVNVAESGERTKEFVVWVNLISEVFNLTKLAEKGKPGEKVNSRICKLLH